MSNSTLKIRFLSFVVICLLTGNLQSAHAGNTGKENIGLYLNFTGQQLHRKVQPMGGHLDYLNYLMDGADNSTQGVLNFGLSFAATEKWHFTTGFGMYSDMGISRMNLETTYFAGNINSKTSWGLQAIALIYPVYINPVYSDDNFDFQQFPNSGLYDIDENFRQLRVYDPGLSLLPLLSYQHKGWNLTAGSGLRISTFMPFKEYIDQKQSGGNLRRLIRYSTDNRPAIFSHTIVSASYDLIGKGEVRLGFQAKAALLFGKRTIAYTRTICTWTTADCEEARVVPKSRPYTQLDTGIGIYLKFSTGKP